MYTIALERNVWHLVQKGKMYLATFEQKAGSTDANLVTIKHPDKKDDNCRLEVHPNPRWSRVHLT